MVRPGKTLRVFTRLCLAQEVLESRPRSFALLPRNPSAHPYELTVPKI